MRRIPGEFMSGANVEVNFEPWETLTEQFNELGRRYHFKNLGGPGTTTDVALRCRLMVEDVPAQSSWFRSSPARRDLKHFVYLVIDPFLLEQTRFAVAIFGPSDDLIHYKTLTPKIEAAATGVN